MENFDRIESTPGVLGGKPRVRGTRIPVDLIATMLSSGFTPTEIIDQFPEISAEDVAQCARYASRLKS